MGMTEVGESNGRTASSGGSRGDDGPLLAADEPDSRRAGRACAGRWVATTRSSSGRHQPNWFVYDLMLPCGGSDDEASKA